jgi:carbon-monoxide dehydrogenase medium subunit
MRPVAFSLSMPSRVDEALDALDESPDTVLLAGGQTLTPLLNMRVVRPERIVDLGGIASLRGISVDGSDLVFGSMTRQAALETPIVRSNCPLMVHLAPHIGQPHTRSMGTVGGSIALGSSVSQLCVALLALEGRVQVESRAGERWIQAADLFTGYLSTAIAVGEILTEIRVPVLAPQSGWGFGEVKFRGCDFPILVAVAVIEVRDGECVSARLAVGGVASSAIRLKAVEAELVGRPLDARAIARASEAARAAVSPSGDLRASAEYRRRGLGFQVTAVIRQAVERSLAA